MSYEEVVSMVETANDQLIEESVLDFNVNIFSMNTN